METNMQRKKKETMKHMKKQTNKTKTGHRNLYLNDISFQTTRPHYFGTKDYLDRFFCACIKSVPVSNHRLDVYFTVISCSKSVSDI